MPEPTPRPVALVTGAARRLGAEIVRTLHGAGYAIALHHHRSGDEARALAAALEAEAPDSVLVLQASLDDPEAPQALVEATVARFGRLDALVNNASAFTPTPLGSITREAWDSQFGVNAQAPLMLAQAAAPHLRAAGGAIVNLTDIYAERPLRHHAAYVMSKAALVAATQVLALELAPEVRVNAVAPGAILWPDTGKSDEAKAALMARTPLGRIGTPAEIAGAVLWLLRDATYTTGQVVRLDGGRMLAG